MGFRNISIAPGEYYHIYSRGVDKRAIFLDDSDKKRFVRLLYICNGDRPVDYKKIKNLPLSAIERGINQTAIGAYCLMPNHFHLLLKETKGSGITKFMSKLLTAYSSYFNRKYERTGALFGSEFRAEHLNTDEYLKHVFSYIHLNPLKFLEPRWRELPLPPEKISLFLQNYGYSSYQEYLCINREESCILNKPFFPEYFLTPKEFEANLFSWTSPTYPQFDKEFPWKDVDNLEGGESITIER